jgi:hypothetical protein
MGLAGLINEVLNPNLLSLITAYYFLASEHDARVRPTLLVEAKLWPLILFVISLG